MIRFSFQLTMQKLLAIVIVPNHVSMHVEDSREKVPETVFTRHILSVTVFEDNRMTYPNLQSLLELL